MNVHGKGHLHYPWCVSPEPLGLVYNTAKMRAGTEPTQSAHVWRLHPITFRVAYRRRRVMYIGHAGLCVSCLSVCASPHADTSTDPDITWGMVGGCIVYYTD